MTKITSYSVFFSVCLQLLAFVDISVSLRNRLKLKRLWSHIKSRQFIEMVFTRLLHYLVIIWYICFPELLCLIEVLRLPELLSRLEVLALLKVLCIS